MSNHKCRKDSSENINKRRGGKERREREGGKEGGRELRITVRCPAPITITTMQSLHQSATLLNDNIQ